MEPPLKKAKVSEEEDAGNDTSARIKEMPAFLTEDTTMNVLPSSSGNMLMTLSDGALQYLMAGARANIGLKSGRYCFEVKILCENSLPHEDPTARNRLLAPRTQLRVGLATATSSLFLGETEDSVCFDSEGNFFKGRRKNPGVSQKFVTGDVVTLLVNLDADSPNFKTVSLFKDGQRASAPQALPEHFTNQALYPALSFRNMTVFYNFGPVALVPLPFTCRMIKDASQKDVTIKVEKPGEQHEVLFPVSLPDEGGFDWLDQFLETHPSFTEVSDRALLRWCERSGLARPKTYAAAARSSNDKPEMAFGIADLDDLSVHRMLQASAEIQKRNLVVMEMKSSLLKSERKELTARWMACGCRRVAAVVVGDPPASFRAFSQEMMLRMKQEALTAEFKAKVQEERKKTEKNATATATPVDAESKAKKVQEALKKKAEFELRKREAELKGETFDEKEEDEDEVKDVDLEDVPQAELTTEEKKLVFRKAPVNDLAPYVLNTNFQNFSLPEEEEDFEEIRWVWQEEDKARQHLNEWIQMKKLTSRLEDLVPGDWFNSKWKEWQKVIQSHQAKQNAWKAAEAKKLSEEKGTGEVDFEHLDVFGVEDVTDVGGGEPLFAFFSFEDWTLMSLRYELHLMAHAFSTDSNDSDRVAVPVEHLQFYYQKYYKKVLNPKAFGVDNCEELVDLIRDTVLITGKSKVLEAQLPEDLESTNLFVMLTEESRRDRHRRIDMGDDAAKLKIQGHGHGAALGAMSTTQAKPNAPTLSQQVMAASRQRPNFSQVRPSSPFGEKGYEKGFEKGGYDKGYYKGYDKGYDKGYGKGGYNGWEGGYYQNWGGW